ncbi:phospholipase D family protein [Ramlibacter sp. G-1-2-2]|uniref:Phospholipase D family protein n=1 Tax=Ramlibacter agri TaxID=2728837 RepID=A0A848GZV9_9BURK|nr:phospholipase D family protein [Ramlibacter agri]NML42892.1 phospholipase D family protein [Ramlibacter agri]
MPHPTRVWRLLALALTLLCAACAQLPANVVRTPSYAIAEADTAGTRIGQVVAPLAASHPRQTGAYALNNGLEAFAARLELANAAQRTLDLQYYIWHTDTSGFLMARALWEAAERGVHVRVLLDDGNTAGMDPALMAFSAHPNIEVRLFNPFANRSWRAADFVSDFNRVQRRMHNKSFTADNQVTVVGGRNIGDEYLGGVSAVAFADLDVMAIGSVVQEVSADFDEYWNSASAYPAASLLRPLSDLELAQIRKLWDEYYAAPESRRYLEAARSLSVVPRMRSGALQMSWGTAYLLSDDPAKVLNAPERDDLHLGRQLMAGFSDPKGELLLVSPYFVPGRMMTDMLVAYAARGVKVSVLTNSLAATDVPPVYAGYLRYRDDLVRGGVHIYELKPAARPPGLAKEDEERVRGLFGSRGGSSGASLHAKTFEVDRKRIFVGSYNLDPRSARLNTELGILLDTPPLATMLAEVFEEFVVPNAYELAVGENGKIVWIDHTAAGDVRYTDTPATSGWKNFWVGVLSGLPIEGLL